MQFNAADLLSHAQTWLIVVRQTMHNTNKPQLKNLLHPEVVALESMIAGLEAGRYLLIDKTQEQVNLLRDVYEKKKLVKLHPWQQEVIDQITSNTSAAQDFKPCTQSSIVWDNKNGRMKTLLDRFPIKETPLPAGIDFAIMGGDSTVYSRVTYANGEIKREILDSKDVMKSPEEMNRDRLAELTKLSPVQVRLVIAQMKGASTHDVAYTCLKRYGESLAGKGMTVEEASTYYADYHIDRVMKELGE